MLGPLGLTKQGVSISHEQKENNNRVIFGVEWPYDAVTIAPLTSSKPTHTIRRVHFESDTLVEKLYPTRHTTVGSVIDAGLGIFAFCLECDYAHNVDLERYARELGRDQSVVPVHLIPKLHCPNCLSKNIGTVLVQPGAQIPEAHVDHMRKQRKGR